MATGAYQFSISDNGSLIYAEGQLSGGASQYALQLVDRSGIARRLSLPPAPYNAPRISPNGKQAAFSTDDNKEAIVWIYDLDGKTSMRRLTFGGKNINPVWSADGQRIASATRSREVVWTTDFTGSRWKRAREKR